MELEIAAPASAFAEVDDERDLVERARHDRRAFADLYRRHYPAIARYVLRRTGDAHAAEDLAADVFLAALRGLPRFRYRDVPVRAWLYRIATNGANRWAKKRRRRAIREWSAAVESQARHGGDDDSTSAEAALTGDMARQAMLTLSPKHQSVLALHYLEGLSVAQIAGSLGCREGTVKSRLARGRDALRERLENGRTHS
ncbi:MAG TPA: RNA polymerase sigma factor [Phycisphaerae bacterium]|nr:RNA polymerase sigma factor [Phycisphaerae bacterium]